MRKLPNYLPLNNEKVSVLILKDFNKLNNVYKHTVAASNGACKLIAITEDYLAKPKRAAEALKEEAIHYFDQITGFSMRHDVKNAAIPLLNDDERMDTIEELSHTIRPGKNPIRKYDEISHIPELLVEYFFIRDYLQSQAERSGSFLSRIKNRHKEAASTVTAEMEKMFGPDYCALCSNFEEKLRQQAVAQSLSTTTA